MAFLQPAESLPVRRPDRRALIFIFVTTFLGSIGFGLINPVAAFLVARYVSNADNIGLILGWLTSAYAICQFLAAPALGVLSDRFGRRPVLLICLLGSAIGYLVFGIGGALWVLFAGRIIDGITGANFAVTFAYVADVTPPAQRGRYFGLVGVTAGIGSILGPTIGGLLSKLGYEAPLYAAAAITFANIVYGLLFAPESLSPEKRSERIALVKLNPFNILFRVFSIRALRWLLIVTFLYGLPFATLQANVTLFAKDSLNWDADSIGILFTLVGATDILVQGLALPRLLKRYGERRVAVGGLCSEAVGYALIATTVPFHLPAMLLIGTIFFAMGDGLLGPSISGLISGAAGAHGQGQVQGGSQAVQALARIAGPVLGGLVYDSVSHAAPYLTGAAIVLVAALIMSALLSNLHIKSAVNAVASD